MDLSQPLAIIQEQAMGARSTGEEPLLSHIKVSGWATHQEVLGYDIDTERMIIALPTQIVDDLGARVAAWTAKGQSATVREVLVLSRKLHHASFVVRPGRYLVRRLLLSNLHLSGAEQTGGEEALAKYREWQKRGWFYGCRVNSWLMWGGGDVFGEGGGYGGKPITAPFFIVKQRASSMWFSDASLAAIGGLL